MSQEQAPYGDAPAQPESPYTNDSQQRLLKVLDALGKRLLEDVPLQDLQDACGGSRDQTFRACKNLEQAGWATQTPSGGWRLTGRLTGISERLRLAIHDLHHTYLNPGGGRHEW